MKILTVLVMLCATTWAKTPTEDKVERAKAAAETKKKEEKKPPPDKITDSDRFELMYLEASRQSIELKRQVVELQAQLLQCQMPQGQKTIEERRKQLLDTYKLGTGDTVKDDGSIVRKKP